MKEDLFYELNRFMAYLRSIKLASSHTVRAYESDLRQFLQGSQGILNEIEVKKFLAHLYFEGKKKKSVLRKQSALRAFSKFLVKEKVISHDPTREIFRVKQEKKLPKVLSYEEIVRFFEAPDVKVLLGLRDRAIMEVLYSSAIRISELVGLERNDIDFKNKFIKVRGKRSRERIVPMTDSALYWLEKYLIHPDRYQRKSFHEEEKDHRAIFLNRWGRRMTTRSIDRLFLEYQRAVGLARKITPHVLRHSIATHLLERGMDLKSIQEILGHTSLSATEIYTFVTPQLKKEVYDRTHPLVKK